MLKIRFELTASSTSRSKRRWSLSSPSNSTVVVWDIEENRYLLTRDHWNLVNLKGLQWTKDCTSMCWRSLCLWALRTIEVFEDGVAIESELSQPIDVLEQWHSGCWDEEVIFDLEVVLTDDEIMEESPSYLRRFRFFWDRETSFPLDDVDIVDRLVSVTFNGTAVDALRFLSEVAVDAASFNRFMIFRSAPFSILKILSFNIFCLPSVCLFLSSIFVRSLLSCFTHPNEQFRTSSAVW